MIKISEALFEKFITKKQVYLSKIVNLLSIRDWVNIGLLLKIEGINFQTMFSPFPGFFRSFLCRNRSREAAALSRQPGRQAVHGPVVLVLQKRVGKRNRGQIIQVLQSQQRPRQRQRPDQRQPVSRAATWRRSSVMIVALPVSF